MMKYIIKFTDNAGYVTYAGEGTYIFQGEKYLIVVERRQEARMYSSKSRAIKAANSYQRTCCNTSGNIEIVTILDKEN